MQTGVRTRSHQVRPEKGPRSRFWLIAGIVLGSLLFWDIVGPYGLWKLHRMKTYQKQLYLANVEGVKTNAGLEEQIRRLESDRQFQERVVRRELGWVRDGEILYEFLGDRD